MKSATVISKPRLRNTRHTPGVPTPLQARLAGNLVPGASAPTGEEANGSGGLQIPRERPPKFKIVILGLSITSSSGNGHAATYRGLIRELHARGHEVLFLERDAEGCASNCDLPNPKYCKAATYRDIKQLKDRYASAVRDADLVIVGSHVPEGAIIGEWVTRSSRGATAFYDIDTPVTVSELQNGDLDYLSSQLISKYDMYLSFTGGPILHLLEDRYGSPMARALYCSVDTSLYYPEVCRSKWDLGYMGTYSDDRQPALDELLLEPARHWDQGRFVVAGPQYPKGFCWPKNVKRFVHLAPAKQRSFYCSMKFALNITHGDTVEAGYSPSVRLFEAAACGTPIISDDWEGLDRFFKPDQEILIAQSSEEALYYILSTTEAERRSLSSQARRRVLTSHTAKHRALELESYLCEVLRPSMAAA